MAARGVLYFLLLAISSGVYGQDVTETKLTTFDWAAGDQFGRSVAISGGYAVVGAWLDDDNGSNSGSAYICERDGLGNWNEVQKLTASDGAENDRFGLSVSISGDYAVIGAYEEDDNYSSGSAYIFERDGAGSWNEVQKLTASDGAENDRFGRSVSISGEYAVIGADLAHGNDFYSGGAYIFDRDGDGNWNEVAKLTASDGAYNDRFGWSVSISGDYAVIGAIGGGYNGTWSGSAYIFEHDRDGNWTEVNKLTASDGAAEDYFGGSVSISGNYAVIGAYGDDDDGSYSASAYVFERDGAGVWSEAQKLTASDAAAGDYFGYSVSISGDYAVIGAGWDDDNGYSSGSAYVYERDGQGNWSEAAKLIASDGAGYDNFGRSVAISGGYAVVGAPDDDDKGTNSGSAYIFDRDGDGDWIQSAKQTSPADDDFFGGSVSISGEYAVVGAGWDDDNGSSSGSAYVYERDGAGNWNEVQKLTASDGAAEDYFGFSVSISGDYAVIGAPHDDDTGPDSGSAYIFERDGLGNWNEVQKLIASDGDAEDYFGGSVSISGNYVVIGSRSRLNISSESAYVFERDELGNWSEVQKLTASDGASGDLFGVSVAISGGYAVVGAVYDDGNGSRSGSAYVFERDGAGNWFEAAKLIASDGAEWDIFGESVSISGDDAVIGAGYDDDNGSFSGSAYVFERDVAGSWNEVQKLTASDGDAGDYVGYSVSISGDFVVLGALGDENDTESNSGSAYIFERDGAGNWIEVQKLIASDGAESDWFGWKVSISGNDAVIGAPYDDDNGSSSGSAYVYQIEPAPVCPGDATGDLVVNLADFSQLLVDYGTTGSSAADFNGDNIVDLADFSILLVNFGNDCTAPLRASPAGGSKNSAWPGPVNESARHFSPIKKKKP